MKTKYQALLVFLILAIPAILSSEPMLWPVDVKPALTSTFAEYRPGHFHSGVDMKTYGKIGPKCLAVDDGWISRVKVSEGGYGRALYLTLYDGRTAVYAHLDEYSKVVEDLVRQEQMAQKQFAVELFFRRSDAIHFKKGESVGYAGRSGVKHAHLHFEMRDVHQRPKNPILDGLDVPDQTPPVPSAIAIIPLDGMSTVERDPQPRIYEHLVKRHDGIWINGDPIGVHGRVGISVDAYDKASAAENLLAVYRIEMLVNGEQRWVTSFDQIDFNDTRKMELERDYRLLRRGVGIFHRLYRMPGNDLRFCSGDGVIDFPELPESQVEVEIGLVDAAGNRSRVAFTLVSDREPSDDRLVNGRPLIEPYNWNSANLKRISFTVFDDYVRLAAPPGIIGFILDGTIDVCLPVRSIATGVVTTWVPPAGFSSHLEISAFGPDSLVLAVESVGLHPTFPGRSNQITTEDGVMRLDIPVGALYDTTWIQTVHEPSFEVPDLIESVYRIEPMDQPLAGKIQLSVKREADLPLSEGWGIYYLDSKRGWTFLGSEESNGYLVASALSWEVFGLHKDIDPPMIDTIKPVNGSSFTSRRPGFHFRVIDRTSGLIADGMSMTLDGERLPAEYDPPRDRLIFKPWWDLSLGEHSLNVHCADRVGNESDAVVRFTIVSQ